MFIISPQVVLQGRVVPLAEFAQQIDKVTAGDVSGLVAKMIKSVRIRLPVCVVLCVDRVVLLFAQTPSVAAYGDLVNVQRFDQIQKAFA